MIFNEDDRSQRLIDIFSHLKGQVNVSFISSTEPVVAWHKHNKQIDYWICLKGSLKVGLFNPELDDKVRWEYLSDKNFRIIEILPGIYHGYKATEPNSILLYYVSRKYDPNDEIRENVGAFGESWIVENK